jgi:cardiolipin synthase
VKEPPETGINDASPAGVVTPPQREKTVELVSPFVRRQSLTLASVRDFTEQAFARGASAPLVAGNSVRLLRNAEENYPAWLEAIESAERTIHFESYTIHGDDAGHQFAEVLMRKARDGIRVRLLYDWMGSLGKTSRLFWRWMERSGVEIRCVNPPRIDSPLGWLSRDHRKLVTVDGRIGFVAGLCIGSGWLGDAAQAARLRDTGIAVRGPAVADLDRAFAQMWDATGAPLPAEDVPQRAAIARAGDTALRVFAIEPDASGFFSLDQLIAGMARKSLWLADAYFAATPAYVHALTSAARGGVDVRLLVPGGAGIPVLRALSQAGYRPLLEADVRVFEWNGSMMHAKTAVADGRWSRVGATNLTPASWLGHWELDALVEDERFGKAMEEMYLDDLSDATEIVLDSRRRIGASASGTSTTRRVSTAGGTAGRAAAGAIRLSNTAVAAIASRRALAHAEGSIILLAALLLMALAVVGFLWPRVFAVPLAAISAWCAVSIAMRAFGLRGRGGPDGRASRGVFSSQFPVQSLSLTALELIRGGAFG